jgi:prolyl-tRNA synthetase
MQAAGAEEFLLPALHPADLWRTSGRWDAIDETMFRLTDRRGSEYCLAMTRSMQPNASWRRVPRRFHLHGVHVNRDLLEGGHARVADLRTVRSGEGCPVCEGALGSFPALEVGHLFKLGIRRRT